MPTVPQSWKPAGAGEEELDFVLYDSALSTTNANSVLQLFDAVRSSPTDPSNNLEAANGLPQSQRMLIKEIGVIYNELVQSDDENSIAENGILRVAINSKTRFECPLLLIGSGGSVVPAGATQDEDHVFARPFMPDPNIVLMGGNALAVTVITGDTAPTASSRVTVYFRGTLVRPAG